jgi:hypothetical protein
MLEDNLKSARLGKERKRAPRLCRAPLWTSILSAAILALLPVGTAAQTASTTTPQTQIPGFGSNAQTPLRLAGETGPENLVSLSLGTSAFFDDNVLANNADRMSDEALAFTSHLGVSRRTQRLAINFDYKPFFLLYRKTDRYDRLNHAADLSLVYQLNSRFSLGVHDSFSYVNGVLPSLSGQQILAGPTSPTSLNLGIYSYTTRTLSNTSGLDLTFTKSRRTSLTFSAGYNQLKFGNQAGATQSLYSSDGVSAGLQYQYRVSYHTSLGLVFLHQDDTYQGGQVFGNRLRSQAESVFIAVGSRLSPTVTLSLYGGPQYVRTLGASSVAGGGVSGFQGAGGGSVTKEVRKTALNVSVLRSVSSSGGLYTSTINTYANFGVRRRLVGHWEGNIRGGAAQADASIFRLANGKTDALTGGVDLNRPFAGGSNFHISYDTDHQLSKGTLPISANFDRDQVTIGFDYQLKAIPLGR